MKQLTLILCSLCATALLDASSLVNFTPAATTVVVGDPLEVDLSIGPLPQVVVLPADYGISDLYAFEIEVDFDPTIFQVNGVNEGTLLPNYATAIATSTAWFSGIVDNVDGSVGYIADTLVGASSGADTSQGGLLFSVDFQAIAPSAGSTISISNVCMQNYEDDVPNGTCELSEDVIGTDNLNATSIVEVDAAAPVPEPASWIYGVITATVVLFGAVRRKRPR
jgi:hypothetical protein